jgi:SAM-dependent methyltransferase
MTREEDMPADAFDCIICTQTLLVIYDFRAAIRTLTRGLKPGGVLLMTNPGISRLCRPDVDLWGDYWRFTTLSMRRLLEEVFPPEQVRVEAYGNVLTASAALYGLAASELSSEQLDLRDADYEVIIAARALKAN